MFNSQKINNDPYPYKVNGGSMTRCDKPGFVGKFDPRPEYDNNPNPILQEFREFDMVRSASTTRESAAHLLLSFDAWIPSWGKGYTREHIDHAKRVLEKLVNVYG